jgi:acetolactate synthase-1/2/3 large subunit
MWAAQFLKTGPRKWITSGGLGTMGYGLPAALGVKLAIPDMETICVSGDGSFQMNIQELGTIAHYNIAVKTVILNNGWLGMVRQWQETFYGERYEATDLEKGTPDFVKLAHVYGIKGITVNTREELPGAIAQMLAHNGPVILDVHVTRAENCYPMVAPGKSNMDMLGLPQPESEVLANTTLECPSCHTSNPSHHKCCSECGTKL